MKVSKYLIPILLIILSIIISYLILVTIKKPIINKDSLATHYGLFLGFGLTIYTFIFSILSNIIDRIDKNVKIKQKDKIIKHLFSGINHLKQDVFGILIIFIIDLIILIPEFIFKVDTFYFLLIKQALFIYSLIIIYDISKVLFGIGDILMSLLNHRNNK